MLIRLPEAHPVISVGRLGEAREFAAGGPVKVAAVDDDAWKNI